MYQYKVEFIFDSKEEYTKEELRDIINENMLEYADNAPFGISFKITEEGESLSFTIPKEGAQRPKEERG
jgi:hypothetical protein